MSRRVSSAPGKIFLWFIVIAMACLLEGALLQSSSYAEASRSEVATAPTLERAEPQASAGLHRVARALATVVRVIK